jgi:hypothetical protein
MLGASEGIMDGASLGIILGVSLGTPLGASVGTADGASLGCEDGALEGALDGELDGDSDGAALGAKVGAVDGERDGELDGDNVGAVVGALVGALLGLTVGDSETILDLERLRNWDLLLDFFFDLLLLSLDLPLDFLDFPSSLDLSVLFFDAVVSDPFFLDLLLLSDFVEAACFFSEPFFLDLLLSDFGDFFFSEALDSFSVLREPFFLASALSKDSPFFVFETAVLDLPLDLLDLDFFEDSLDFRLRDSSSGSSKKKESEYSWVGIKVLSGNWWEGIEAEAGIIVVGAKVGDKVTTSSKLLLLLLLLLLTDLLDFLEDLLALVDLDLDSLDFLARRWCEVASDDSTKAARRPWRTGRLVVTVVDAEVKVVVAARRTIRCFVEKYMMLLLF